MDLAGEIHVPTVWSLAVSAGYGLVWVLFVAGLVLYPVPERARFVPLKIAVFCLTLLFITDLLWTFGVFGRFSALEQYQPQWVVSMKRAVLWGMNLGSLLLAGGAWVAARSLVSVMRREPPPEFTSAP